MCRSYIRSKIVARDMFKVVEQNRIFIFNQVEHFPLRQTDLQNFEGVWFFI